MAVDANILSLPAMIPPAAVSNTAANSGNSITSTSNDGNVVAGTSGLRYFGFSCMEDAGGTASFIIKHSSSESGGTNIEFVTLLPGQTTGAWYGPSGMVADNGISILWVSGSFKCTIRHKVVT